MAWQFERGQTRQSIIDRFTQPSQGSDCSRSILGHAVADDVLWILVELKQHETGKILREIECIQMSEDGPPNRPDSWRKGWGWGYQSFIDDVNPPPFYSCPLDFVEQSTMINPEWRALVVEHHNTMKAEDN